MENFLSLQELYKDDEYMKGRLQYYMSHILPANLKHEKQQHEKREERNKALTDAQQIFIQVFLSKHNYFYLHGIYYYYDGLNYSVIKEDDIYHTLLSSISNEKTLMDWKHKTKFIVMKQIREKNLFHSIPETETIHAVLDILSPSVFQEREMAKYFLTVIGDNILKKTGDLHFLINSDAKRFLSFIESIGQTNSIGNIFTKYHESYSFSNCRLFKVNASAITWNSANTNGIDILCVATYYSLNRYGSSENFLLHANTQLQDYVLFFKNTPQKYIIDTFCKNAIEKADTSSITWKQMHYLWKLHLSSSSLPNMIYSNNLKQILKEYFNYDESTDSFLNITSKSLPLIKDFLSFWENCINEEPTTQIEELELDELCELFKKWTHQTTSSVSSGNMDEHCLSKILVHFFPHVEMIQGKYIKNIRCSLWNKGADIDGALVLLKTQKQCLLSIADDAYSFYLKYCRKNKYNNVNKRFFEKYVELLIENLKILLELY